MDETTGEKAFFTYKLSSTLIAAENYRAQLPGLWQGGGIAVTSYEYQLLICDTVFYSGFFISGKSPNCYKQCNYWCSDITSPYFRSAVTSSGYGRVAFNVNGHRPRNSRLISVGLRWVTWRCYRRLERVNRDILIERLLLDILSFVLSLQLSFRTIFDSIII